MNATLLVFFFFEGASPVTEARVTQATAEVVVSQQAATSARLTQESLEVVVLPPQPGNPVTGGFDDCGTYLGPRECEVRIYDESGLSQPIDLYLVFDVSPSMSTAYGSMTRLEAAKIAVGQVLGQIIAADNGSRVGLVTFSYIYSFEGELYGDYYRKQQALTTDLIDLIDLIDGLTTGAATATGSALTAARSFLENESGLGNQPVLMVVSDGEWNVGSDPHPVADAIKAAHPDWLLYAVDINDGTANESNQYIGQIVGDGFFSVQSPAELTSAIHTLVAGNAPSTLDAPRKCLEIEDWIDSVEWEILERGGCGSGSFSALATWEDLRLSGNERVDVYLFGHPAYRGWVRVSENDLAEEERVKPQLYGLMEKLDHWLVDRKLCYGTDTDLSTVFSDLMDRAVRISGRLPAVSVSFETIGVTVTEFDARGKSVTQALNQLSDVAPNTCIWGCDFDTSADWRGRRENRIYLRRRSTTCTRVYALSDNVTGFIYPIDSGRVINSLKVDGGQVKQPNLLTNGSFEDSASPSDTVGNWLQDSSFEDGRPSASWSLSGGATVKYSGHPTAHGSARTGYQWLELDTNGETAQQTVPIISGEKYIFSVWARYEDVLLSVGGQIWLYLEGLDASDNVVATSQTIDCNPGGAIYRRYTATLDLAAYPTVTQARVRIVGKSGTANNDGILVDDVALNVYGEAAQVGWRPEFGGDAALAVLDWDHTPGSDTTYAEIARSGGTILKLQASGTGVVGTDYAGVRTQRESRVTVQPNERYTALVFWQGAAVDFTLGAVCFKSDASQTGSAEEKRVQGTAAIWTYAFLDFMTPSDAASVEIYIRLNNNAAAYFDDAMLVLSEAPEDVSGGSDFWTGETYEAQIDVTDTGLSGLSASALASITNYGQREAAETVTQVVDRDTLLTYAASYFNAHAIPEVAGTLTVEGPQELLEQGGTVRLINIAARPEELFPSRVRYSVRETIRLEADLGRELPDMADLLRLTAARSL